MRSHHDRLVPLYNHRVALGVKRLRGMTLRLVRDRRLAIGVGLVLIAPAVTLVLMESRWEAWYTDAAGLVLGGTGAALLVAGLGGHRPDWLDAERNGECGKRDGD